MGRRLACSLAGAGIGFLLGLAGVLAVAAPEPARDTGAVILFVGAFLAGTGAIAGAIVGAAKP